MARRDIRATPETAGCDGLPQRSSKDVRRFRRSAGPADALGARVITWRSPELPCDRTGAMPGRILVDGVPKVGMPAEAINWLPA
jgi:hypothetical protein